MYRSAQRQFIDFCTLDGYVTSNGSLLPTNEQTLLRFCSHLAGRLHHSSIKVYLSAIRSLHIDQGFPDPLENCLQLQRLLRGIKRHQGSTLPQRQLVTSHLMRFIQRSLDTHNSGTRHARPPPYAQWVYFGKQNSLPGSPAPPAPPPTSYKIGSFVVSFR